MRFRYRNPSAHSLPHRLPQGLRTGPCVLIITTSTWESVSTAMSGHRGLSQKVTSPTAPDSKRIAYSCQTREASFITPYRNHRGHAGVVALLPTSSRGRGASDTVRAIIGSSQSGRRIVSDWAVIQGQLPPWAGSEKYEMATYTANFCPIHGGGAASQSRRCTTILHSEDKDCKRFLVRSDQRPRRSRPDGLWDFLW